MEWMNDNDVFDNFTTIGCPDPFHKSRPLKQSLLNFHTYSSAVDDLYTAPCSYINSTQSAFQIMLEQV